MNDKNKIYDYACGVVNSDKVITFKSSNLFDSDIKYRINDAVLERFEKEAGKADLILLVQGKINLNDVKESLITHVVKEFTKLINDGYTIEVK